MNTCFIGEVFQGRDREKTLQAQAGITSDQYEETLYLTSACSSLEHFEKEIQRLQKELEDVLSEVRAQWDQLTRHPPQADHTQPTADPESIWENMKTCDSDEAMFSYFNGFDEDVRQQVADYILTQVNMFQGKAPVFASHYNATTFVLE
jgi:hypothetical protein